MPPTEELYPSVEARIAARKAMFAEMDKQGKGYITLNEWIDFILSHMRSKIKFLPKVSYYWRKFDDTE